MYIKEKIIGMTKKKNILISVALTVILWQLYVLLPLLFSSAPLRGELKVLDRHDQQIAHVPFPDGYFSPLQHTEPLPDFVSEAFLSIEDERFHSHWGIDSFAKLRALRSNFQAQKVVSGGSTITEQLIKNRYFPISKRTLLQKLREANLAFYFSIIKSKDEVFRDYLNSIYFGNRICGIKAAMRQYFGKSHLETLTQSELITLLAILRSPGVVNTSEKYFQERFAQISDRLYGEDLPIPEVSFAPFASQDQLPHVTNTIKQQLRERFGGYLSSTNSSVTVKSTIDMKLQLQAREIMQKSLTLLAENQVSNAAVYAMQPGTGEILIWQGSRDFHHPDIDGQVNIITSLRQMGSALKPFLYYLAFQEGYHPDQLIVDLEKDFPTLQKEQLYRPLNYGMREGGIMPLKMALANSFNIASVRLLEILGLNKVYRHFKSMGLPLQYGPEHYGYSLALGTPDLPMQAVADAYAQIANGEGPVNSHLIRSFQVVSSHSVEGSYKKSPIDRFQARNQKPATSVASFHLWNTLSNPLNRRRSFGTYSVLNSSVPMATKTGTTKNFKDNWTFGYLPATSSQSENLEGYTGLVVATWVGNNDSSAMVDIDGITGAGPIWNRVIEAATKEGYLRPYQPEVPEGLEQVRKCLNSECNSYETIFSSPDRSWESDFEVGVFCREEFVDPDIPEAELSKVAKLFGFEKIEIQDCSGDEEMNRHCEGSLSSAKGECGNLSRGQSKSSPHNPDHPNIPNAPNLPTILSPQSGEVFTINPDIPIELQQIKLKANQEVDWYLDDVWVGYKKILYIKPVKGFHTLRAQFDEKSEERQFEVRDWSE